MWLEGEGVTREIITGQNASIKLGVIDSQIGSVRTGEETETAVRVIDHGCVGVASAVGKADLDALTHRAREGLSFEIDYPVKPGGPTQLHTVHDGVHRTVDELVELTNHVLGSLREAFPNFVYSHGVEQTTVGWRYENDNGLDLSYRRTGLDMSFVIKEKGSGNIFDTYVTASGPDVDPDEVVERFSEHLSAISTPAGDLPTGPQRIVMPGIDGHAAATLVKLFRSDLVARPYQTGASVFSGKVGTGEPLFSPRLNVVDTRNAARMRVCPFDMEGVVRAQPDLELISDGCLMQVVASQRDQERYGVPATGSAVGNLSQLPVSGVARLDVLPTASTLVDLLAGEPALLMWFEAGGDVTRAGDFALPAIVLLKVESDGRVSGRYPGATLTGSLYDIFGDGFVGVTEERIWPGAEQPYLVTTMDVQG